MIADIISIKKIDQAVSELFIRGRKHSKEVIHQILTLRTLQILTKNVQ